MARRVGWAENCMSESGAVNGRERSSSGTAVACCDRSWSGNGSGSHKNRFEREREILPFPLRSAPLTAHMIWPGVFGDW